MNKIPNGFLAKFRSELWARADAANWIRLSDAEKAYYYEEWQNDPDIGGVLGAYADIRNVRVYIKDTIMKPYAREKFKDISPILRLLEISESSPLRPASFIKPHGRILRDGRIITWGPARDWKSILVATCERAFLNEKCVPFAAALVAPSGKLNQPSERKLVEHVASRLGIAKLAWGGD